jgi:hypothetical protein
MPRRQRPKLDLKMTVRSVPQLNSRLDFIVPQTNKRARTPDRPGVIVGIIPPSYLVLHENELTAAVYDANELLAEPNAYWRVSHPVEGVPYFKEIATHTQVVNYIDELDSGVTATVEGPFYSDKELEEGPQATQDLFEHLINDV